MCSDMSRSALAPSPCSRAPIPSTPDDAPTLGLEVHSGGGPANTAVALARLGSPTRFLGRLSADAFGRLFRIRFEASGVDLSHCPRAEEPSTLAVADLDGEGRASHTFHAERTAQAVLPAHRIARTGPQPGGRSRRAVATRGTDPSHCQPRPQRPSPACCPQPIPRSPAALVPGGRRAPGQRRRPHPPQPEQAADEWHALGVRVVVITLGPDGALASLDGTRLRVPAPRTRVVDTVGAGDAFVAGLLHALGSGRSRRQTRRSDTRPAARGGHARHPRSGGQLRDARA
jgi:fructokinase